MRCSVHVVVVIIIIKELIGTWESGGSVACKQSLKVLLSRGIVLSSY